MLRPNFTLNMSINEFKNFYWYKNELEEICKKYNLPSYGTKAELTTYILKLLSGENPSNVKSFRKRRKSGLLAKDITLQTKILNSGFSLNQEARKFFCSYYSVDKFSFTKSMGVMMRKIEADDDKQATIMDLIQSYEHSNYNLDQNDEEKTYQWNNFIKDFSKDSLSNNYQSKMKVAAILWSKVRNSNQEKKYNHKLIQIYNNEIKQYLKNEN